MTSHGAKNIVETLKRGCLSPELLALKIGARVMFTKNDMNRLLCRERHNRRGRGIQKR